MRLRFKIIFLCIHFHTALILNKNWVLDITEVLNTEFVHSSSVLWFPGSSKALCYALKWTQDDGDVIPPRKLEKQTIHMNHLRNEVRNHTVPRRELQMESTTRKGRSGWAEVGGDMKLELAVEGETDERKNSKNLHLSRLRTSPRKNLKMGGKRGKVQR